ncbi:hypothetical protein JCGZ_02400 [Jatropha curcas]|uniref:Uncharacterized protein n=1 Tax=Jatropha curcas TaxID=180498 RepID=A0A067JFT3_JATCU|nr:hypothetical protein JCGZ_02400 [Jatropha curcas]
MKTKKKNTNVPELTTANDEEKGSQAISVAMERSRWRQAAGSGTARGWDNAANGGGEEKRRRKKKKKEEEGARWRLKP